MHCRSLLLLFLGRSGLFYWPVDCLPFGCCLSLMERMQPYSREQYYYDRVNLWLRLCKTYLKFDSIFIQIAKEGSSRIWKRRVQAHQTIPMITLSRP